MNINSIATAEPEFDFKAYFLGHTKASGWFCDRFGNIRKHFNGDFFGSVDGDKFILDETLAYSDGINESRLWKVSIDSQGNFRAEGDSLLGEARGRLVGNTLNLQYAMWVEVAGNKKWKLSMDDWMVYQPDGSLHNVTRVKKWGVLVGVVSTQYAKLKRSSSVPGSANDANASIQLAANNKRVGQG